MEQVYFITGILSTFVAILLYQYSKILTSYKLIQRNHKQISEAYEQWIKITTSDLDKIRESMANDNYADATAMSSQLTSISAHLNALESQINTLAKKEDNDVKMLITDITGIQKYIKSVVQDAAENRGY